MTINSDSSTYTNAAYSNQGVSGLASGLDTESLVQSMLSGIQTKIDKKTQEQQQLEWKQTQYRSVIDQVNTFQTQYLSLTSDTSVRTSAMFSAKTTSSSSSAITVTAGTDAINGSFDVQVAQLATATKVQGAKVGTGSITLAASNTVDRSISIKVGEDSVSVDLSGAADNAEITSRINTALSDAGSSATVTLGDDGKLSYSGSEACTISGSTAGLGMLGLTGSTSATATTTGEGEDAVTTYDLTTGELDVANTATTSFTMSLDGISKSFTLTEGGSMTELQTQAQKAFGSSVKFTQNDDGTFSVTAGTGQSISIDGTTEALAAIGLDNAASTRMDTSAAISTLKLGAGELTEDSYEFSINGTSFTASSTDTMADIMERVNESDCGVTMAYNSLDDSFSLTAADTGAGYTIGLEDADGFLGALGLTGSSATTTAGQNAVLNVNGNVIERTTNDVTYDGLTMTLNRTTGDYTVGMDAAGNTTMTANGIVESAKISAQTDTESIKETLTSFVAAYNVLIDNLNDMIHEEATYKKYAPLTDAQRDEMSETEIEKWEEKAKTGLLHNDSDISDFLLNMRSAMYSKFGETTLSAIGIDSSSEYTEYGKLIIDEDALDEALQTNIDGVKELFLGSDGLASKLNQVCNATANTSSGSPGTLVQTAGVVGKATEKTNMITTRLTSLDDRITELKNLYEMRKTRYWAQFNSMETSISSFSSTSAYLSNISL